jgi:hypothetical protein
LLLSGKPPTLKYGAYLCAALSKAARDLDVVVESAVDHGSTDLQHGGLHLVQRFDDGGSGAGRETSDTQLVVGEELEGMAHKVSPQALSAPLCIPFRIESAFVVQASPALGLHIGI